LRVVIFHAQPRLLPRNPVVWHQPLDGAAGGTNAFAA
jgi:hypothetical protein